MGTKNTFGYSLAPRLGDGAVMLQPREAASIISIGNCNVFSNNIAIIATQRICFGSGCLIGDQVMVLDFDGHEIAAASRKRGSGVSIPVHIGNNVWLGSRTMILKGVSIGDNTVIGAMSVVVKSLPPNCVAAGVPAKILRKLE